MLNQNVQPPGALLLGLAPLPGFHAQVLDQASRRKLPEREVEMEVFGTTHAELGACLLGTRGVGVSILEAVAWHNRPMLSDDTRLSSAIRPRGQRDRSRKAR